MRSAISARASRRPGRRAGDRQCDAGEVHWYRRLGGRRHQRMQREDVSGGSAPTAAPGSSRRSSDRRGGRERRAAAAAAISASGTHSSTTSAPAPSLPRPSGNGRRSAAASAEPMRPRPMTETVLSIKVGPVPWGYRRDETPLAWYSHSAKNPGATDAAIPVRRGLRSRRVVEAGAPRGAEGRLRAGSRPAPAARSSSRRAARSSSEPATPTPT